VVRTVIPVLLGGSACLLAAAIVCWYLSSTYAVGVSRGKRLLAAYLLYGSAICTAGLAQLVYETHLAVFETEGNIEAVQIRGGKRPRSNLFIHTISESYIAVHASGTSRYFRRGQRLRVRYHDKTGAILSAVFLSADGNKEGVFNDTDIWTPYFVLLTGLFLAGTGVIKYRRDPGGSEDSKTRNFIADGSVDEASLLKLSDR
jgi:hypothetical protein